MNEEIMSKRPAEVVRPPLSQTLVMPAPIGSEILRAKSEKAVLRKLKRLQKRGYIAAASPLLRVSSIHGGGFAVKVTLLRRMPEPMPGWAKGCALVGGVLCVLSGLAIVAIQALADLTRAAALLPWALIIGGLFAVIVVLFFVKRLLGGGGTAVQNNFF